MGDDTSGTHPIRSELWAGSVPMRTYAHLRAQGSQGSGALRARSDQQIAAYERGRLWLLWCREERFGVGEFDHSTRDH